MSARDAQPKPSSEPPRRNPKAVAPRSPPGKPASFYPEECRSVTGMKKFMERETNSIIETWSPHTRRKEKTEKIKKKMIIPDFVDRSKPTSAIYRDFRSFKAEIMTENRAMEEKRRSVEEKFGGRRERTKPKQSNFLKQIEHAIEKRQYTEQGEVGPDTPGQINRRSSVKRYGSYSPPGRTQHQDSTKLSISQDNRRVIRRHQSEFGPAAREESTKYRAVRKHMSDLTHQRAFKTKKVVQDGKKSSDSLAELPTEGREGQNKHVSTDGEQELGTHYDETERTLVAEAETSEQCPLRSSPDNETNQQVREKLGQKSPLVNTASADITGSLTAPLGISTNISNERSDAHDCNSLVRNEADTVPNDKEAYQERESSESDQTGATATHQKPAGPANRVSFSDTPVTHVIDKSLDKIALNTVHLVSKHDG